MTPDISIVIPVRNESPNLEPLHRELTAALAGTGRPYEIVVVEDGSVDDTFARLVAIQQTDPRLRIVRLRRNFGQTAAFAAGFAQARGRYIVTSDGDLQNDPADIPAMLQMAEAGDLDIVCGWRKDRKDPFFSRRLPSLIANRVISATTGVKLHDYGCSLKVFRAEVVKPMKLYGEMHRFLPAIASESGVSIGEMVVNHRRREHGRSNYGIGRTVRVILDLATVKFLSSYRTRPLQMFGGVGLTLGVAGGAVCLYLAYLRLFAYESIGNRPLLLLGILMVLSGIQLVMTGLLAEMLSRTYHESQDKATYVIREIREPQLSRAPAEHNHIRI